MTTHMLITNFAAITGRTWIRDWRHDSITETMTLDVANQVRDISEQEKGYDRGGDQNPFTFDS